MKISLLPAEGGRRRKLSQPFEGCTHVTLDEECPACGKTFDGGVRIQGAKQRISEDDRAYESDAYAMCCQQYVGVLRVETDTLFGVREDEAVLVHSRVKIY